MDPGAGMSVQCLSLEMLVSAGIFVPVSPLPDEEPPW
jgi:hypothetical protein